MIANRTLSITMTSIDPLLTRVLTTLREFSAELGRAQRSPSVSTPIDLANDGSKEFSKSKYAQHPAICSTVARS